MRVQLKLVWQDLWVGIFWRRSHLLANRHLIRRTEVFVCFLPCLPIVITYDEVDLITRAGPKELP